MKVQTLVVGPIETNCYIVSDADGSAAVIDPGFEADTILEALEEAGLTLKAILLTHAHFDHIMAVPALKAASAAPVAIHRLDAPQLITPSASMRRYTGGRIISIEPDLALEDGGAVRMGSLTFTYLHTPGHTPGSAVILCDAPDAAGRLYMFSGDTLFEGDCGRCDLEGGDYQAMLRSLRRLHGLDGDYVVCPGHDVATTLGKERLTNRNMLEAIGKR